MVTRAELRELLAKATPGPLRIADDGLTARTVAHGDLRDTIVIDVSQRKYLEADLRCFVAARNALPTLLDKLDAAERVLDQLGNLPHKPSQVEGMEQCAREALAALRKDGV